MLSRLENDILGNEAGLQAFEAALTRSTDTLLKRKNKERLSIDLDSTEDPAHGKQEWVADNGHVAKHCGAVYSNFYKTVFFSRTLVLSWRRLQDSASRTRTLGDFPRDKRPKNQVRLRWPSLPPNPGLGGMLARPLSKNGFGNPFPRV